MSTSSCRVFKERVIYSNLTPCLVIVMGCLDTRFMKSSMMDKATMEPSPLSFATDVV